MGQQQLLLIILGVIIVGIAIAVGLQLFQAGAVDSNQDAMINDIMNISANADQWRMRPVSMGGGGGFFTAAIVGRINNNEGLMETANGEYEITGGAGEESLTITIEGTSTQGYGTVTLTYDVSVDGDARYTWGGSHDGGIGAAPAGG